MLAGMKEKEKVRKQGKMLVFMQEKERDGRKEGGRRKERKCEKV